MGFREWWTGGEHARADEPIPVDSTPVIPSRDTAARTVAARDAMGLAAVYRAVEIRSIAAKQISIDATREADGMPVKDQPALLRRPDPERSRAQFVEQTVISLNTTGNAYWRCLYTDQTRQKLSSVYVLNPGEVTIRTTRSGRVIGYTYAGKDWGLKDIKHLSRMRVPGTPYGLGPIQAAQVELRGTLDTAEYASEFINSGDVPTGILKTDQILTDDDATTARNQWETSRGGRSGVAVLGKGLDYRQNFISPRDAQFIESQNWNVTTVARLFGVPASLMLVALDNKGQTYQNVEQDWLGFVRFGLANDLIEIEDAFTDLLPRGQRARFNIEALLRADTKSRYEAHNLSLTWRTPNEIRRIEGEEPIDGGDELRTHTPAPTQGVAA